MQRERADTMIRRKYKRYSKHKITYLGLIAYVIQNAPEKKLTFHELMNSVTLFVDGDRKGVENNIRVCLSSNNCFVKVPINPDCPKAKRNFWKVDQSKITPKILRRHFSGLRDVFPHFYDNMDISSVKNERQNRASCKRPETEKKFRSSFSIESLLQRENSAPVRTRPALSASRSQENAFMGLTNISEKRKTWGWPLQTSHVDFRGSYSHFYFPTYSLGQINEGCSSSGGSSKKIHSEWSYCTAHESFRQFTQNAMTWAYM